MILSAMICFVGDESFAPQNLLNACLALPALPFPPFL